MRRQTKLSALDLRHLELSPARPLPQISGAETRPARGGIDDVHLLRHSPSFTLLSRLTLLTCSRHTQSSAGGETRHSTKGTMAARRSQRRGGEKLSDRLADVEAQAKKQVYADKRAKQEAKYAEVKSCFRFLDLLPELRLKIYAYAMGGQRRSLTDIKMPILAMVSKQVRAEALPVFFSECVFTATIGSNYATISALDNLAARDELPDFSHFHRYFGYGNSDLLRLSHDQSGYLRIYERSRDIISKWRKRESVDAAFKNVDLRVATLVQVRPQIVENWTMFIHVPTASKPKPKISYSNIHITTAVTDEDDEDGDLGVESQTKQSSYTELDPWRSSGTLQSAQDQMRHRLTLPLITLGTHAPAMNLVRKRAEAHAEELAASGERFVGFTLEDLGEIAKTLKYWPVEQAVRERSALRRGRGRRRRLGY